MIFKVSEAPRTTGCGKDLDCVSLPRAPRQLIVALSGYRKLYLSLKPPPIPAPFDCTDIVASSKPHDGALNAGLTRPNSSNDGRIDKENRIVNP